jgi:hypothetical protein
MTESIAASAGFSPTTGGNLAAMHNLGAAAGSSSSNSSPSAVLSQLGYLSAPVAAGGVGGAPGAAGSSVGLGIMVGGVAAGSSSGQLDREVLRKMMQVRIVYTIGGKRELGSFHKLPHCWE